MSRRALVALCASLGCVSHTFGQQLVMTDVTQAVGITWEQIENNTMMGAGVAFLDFDGDGWLDILLAGGDAIPTLYHNEHGGTSFVAVTPSPLGTNPRYECMCVTVGDIDNDGDPDVFLGRFGRNALFRNDGGGRFTDITTPQLAGGQYEFTTTAAFGDFDGDGNLDLYIGNYITPGGVPPHHIPTPNVLLRGHGDGSFTDVTSPITAGAGTALASTFSDFDGDGDPDILLENDFGAFVEPNQIYRNDGPVGGLWRFTQCAQQVGADVGMFCMGIAIGDIDRDGDLDYYLTNMGRNVLLRNVSGHFTDIATQTGTELTWDIETSPLLLATSWGCGFADFDCDGWLDLYVSNGFIPADPAMANGEHTRNVLFRNDGPALTFSRQTQPLDDGIGRGCAFGDFDNDGDVDILQGNIGARPVLLRNDSPRAGHWLRASLQGRKSNRDALGARVDLDTGSFTAVREVSRNSSFESSSDARLHFGLADASRSRRIAVRWPSGIEQTLFDRDGDRAETIVEPVATLEGGRMRSFPVPFGRLVWFHADLVNQGTTAVDVLVEPQVRGGWDATPRFADPGDTLWHGRARRVHLETGHARPLDEVLFVPRLPRLPAITNLDFVWMAADAGLGVDEEKFTIR